MGVTAQHVESGRRVSLHGSARLPMASVVKVPIAVSLLALVDRSDLRLDTMIELKPHHVRPDSAVIGTTLRIPGAALSVGNLLELMLVVSDNSASDLLLDLIGGAEAVNGCLRALGVADMCVNRATAELIADVRGNTRETFLADTRDTSSADAMVCLLSAVVRGGALSSESGCLLMDIMSRCETGSCRIKGLLPPGTPVAHKTGYLSSSSEDGSYRPCVVNDAGVVTLPDGSGRIAMAAFVTGSPRSLRVQERVIARTARIVYDHFVGMPATNAG